MGLKFSIEAIKSGSELASLYLIGYKCVRFDTLKIGVVC